MNRREPAERDIQRQVTDYLSLRRVFWFRANAGAFAAEHRGKRRFIRFGTPGQPDIICIYRGRFVGIELKSAKGKQSPSQRRFQLACEDTGGAYILARSVEDVESRLDRLDAR